jgi:hypothetical protein
MTSRAWAGRLRCALGAFVALAAASFPPPKAEAGCSSYVRVASQAQTHPGLDLLAHLPDLDSPAPTDRPAPCRGPSCSGGERSPASTPAAPVAPLEGRWGLRVEVVEPPRQGSRLSAAAADLGRPVRQGLPVDRPPRLKGRPSY